MTMQGELCARRTNQSKRLRFIARSRSLSVNMSGSVITCRMTDLGMVQRARTFHPPISLVVNGENMLPGRGTLYPVMAVRNAVQSTYNNDEKTRKFNRYNRLSLYLV
uniref:Uncharacterized protein n=1 Tax=Ixodes ricinus TaxID=34613 RepID=A0A6B0UGZ2_IXORI